MTSQDSSGVSLVLFTEEDLFNGRATFEIPLDRELNRTGNVWHIMLPSVDGRLLYGARLPPPWRDNSLQQQPAARPPPGGRPPLTRCRAPRAPWLQASA